MSKPIYKRLTLCAPAPWHWDWQIHCHRAGVVAGGFASREEANRFRRLIIKQLVASERWNARIGAKQIRTRIASIARAMAAGVCFHLHCECTEIDPHRFCNTVYCHN